MPKPKKAGRPKLPKGEAMGSVIQVRFNAEDTKGIAVAAKSSDQSISEWIRSMYYKLFPAYCTVCKENVQANIGMSRADLLTALERNEVIWLTHAFPLAPDHKFSAKKEQIDIIRKRIAAGVI